MKTKIWAIIAAYNEAKNIKKVVLETKNYLDHLVVVDDGSKDSTGEYAEEAGALVLSHSINLGKGAALQTGAEYAIRKGARYLIFIDGDGQHDPKEIPRFLALLKHYDIVFGRRIFTKAMPSIMRMGNIIISTAIRWLYHIHLKDTQCGYRAMSVAAYKKIKWTVADYSVESEMIANVGNAHLTYKELPIENIYPERYKGTTVLDGIKIVANLFFWRLRRW